VAVFVAGRRLAPSRALLASAAGVGILFDGASALIGSFPALLCLRAAAGAAAGVITWLAWGDAMRSSSSMRDVAAVGPLTVLVGAPLLGWLAHTGGDQAVYWALAASMVPAVAIPVAFDRERPLTDRRRMSPSRSNVVLIAALGVLTMSGSALFVFLGALAVDEIGLSVAALSVGFSLNAVAGLFGARLRRRPRHAWPWMVAVSVSASAIAAVPEPPVFFAGLAIWGFAFWMAVPRILARVAEWSLVPDERVGDAQSVMALGRAAGPTAAAVLVGQGSSYVPLAVFTGSGLVVAAALVAGVERYRIGRSGPPDDSADD